MRTREENFVSMTWAVRSVLKKHETLWNAKKIFARDANHFFDLVKELGNIEVNAQIVTTGATEDKHAIGNEVINLVVKLAKRASVYALDENNMELHDQLRTSRKSLLSRHDTLAAAKIRDIVNRMRGLSSVLADYDVTDMDLKELDKLVTKYESLVTKPRELIVERKTHNETVPKQLTAIRQMLYRLDSMINMFDETPFEAEYLNARNIVDLGSRGEKNDEPKQ